MYLLIIITILLLTILRSGLSMTKQNIVVVGAGYAGVSATKFLAKKFKKDTDVTITLIDRHSYHTMMTELHEVAGGRVEPEAIQYDLQRLFSHARKT